MAIYHLRWRRFVERFPEGHRLEWYTPINLQTTTGDVATSTDHGLYCQKNARTKISHYRDNSAGYTYQQSSMSLYISFEQPGGGGSLCPSLTRDITWNGSDSQDWHEYGDLSWSLNVTQTSNVCIYACYWIPQDCLWIQMVLSPMTRLHREPRHSSTHHWQQWTCGS